jgi:hypothetical protein
MRQLVDRSEKFSGSLPRGTINPATVRLILLKRAALAPLTVVHRSECLSRHGLRAGPCIA